MPRPLWSRSGLTPGALPLILAAALILAACGGSKDASRSPAPASPPLPAQAQPATPAPTREIAAPSPAPPRATEPGPAGPDLLVPGLAAYTLGTDLFLQRSGVAGRLIEGSQRFSISAPALSPQHDRIAYVRFDQAPGGVGDIGSDIHISDLAGIDLLLLEHVREGEFYWSPRWSPDGRSLFFSHQINEMDDAGRFFRIEIMRLDLDSGQTAVLREHATEPAPSPDGRRLTFVDDPALDHILGVMDADGGNAARLLDTSDGLAFYRLPRFSPAGGWIAFLASGDGPQISADPRSAAASLRANGVQDLWIVRPDGSGLTRLTTVLEDTPDFSWSNDGAVILLRGTFGVYLVDVASRVTQTLGPGEFHGWIDWVGTVPAGTVP